MKFKSIIPVLAATFAITGVSMAEAGERSKKNKNQQHHSQQMKSNTAVGVGAGTATAGRRGAEAGAIIAGGASTSDKCGLAAQTSTTFGTAAGYTDRKTASGAASTGGTASGSGSVASTSDADVWASTSKQNGSEATAYGTSSAAANEPTRRPRGC